MGVSRMSDSIEARAPRAVRVSISSLSSMKKPISPAATYSPVANAATMPSAASSSMCDSPWIRL